MKTTAKIAMGRQLAYVAAALATVLLAIILPVMVSADQLTARSVQLSSASVGMSNVTYEVKFTAAGDAEAFTVDFCQETPLLGQACTQPTNFTAASAASTSTGVTNVTGSVNRAVVAKEIATNEEVVVALTGISNPTVDGTMYARIVTYETATQAGESAIGAADVGSVDSGSVAIAITPTIGVSGTVLETLTFCVSGTAIGANCTGTTTPVVALGNETAQGSGIFALTPGELSEGNLFTQITTNATSGVVVHLKSSTTGCGGLMRAGADSSTGCGILPAVGENIGLNANDNSARFGVTTSDAVDTPNVNATGAFLPALNSIYSNDVYAFNYAVGDATGVTSPFGDPFLDTRSAPATGKNMTLTFGATASTNTPAGSYSADLSMIAVGKF